MKEILVVGNNKIYYRKLYRDLDEFNLSPRGKYEQREATEEDIKRISPKLWEEAKKLEKEEDERVNYQSF